LKHKSRIAIEQRSDAAFLFAPGSDKMASAPTGCVSFAQGPPSPSCELVFPQPVFFFLQVMMELCLILLFSVLPTLFFSIFVHDSSPLLTLFFFPFFNESDV